MCMQALVRVVPLRNYFLQPTNYAASRSQLVSRFGELVRKIWNPRNFKGQVSCPAYASTDVSLTTNTVLSEAIRGYYNVMLSSKQHRVRFC